MQPTIICFGETLFDVLPDGAVPGGAPMNVAIHLNYYGHSPVVVSRVGKDAAGTKLLAFLQEKGVSTAYIQQDDTYQTGIVEADVSESTHVIYTIVDPVAWDYIRYEDALAQVIEESNVFIYGSLASRNPTTRQTLLKYLPKASLKVFDVNLRSPHYSAEGIKELLPFADIIKMNHHELAEIAGWYGISADEKANMEYIRKLLNIPLILVTRGENGASCLTKDGYSEHPGFKVTVKDTIGSGDAFLAAFLHQYLQGKTPAEALPYACAAGAYVATQRGATPRVPESFIEELIKPVNR
ncbi:carbohydrate kinase [Rhodocytophaga aerolata]|uniref:Carbohydrate kinase n=1 Tax=Rhodocytophaga aerolata TaxID=455078 RepID=A0ABT8R484_9BACT|nr:carbohydrate kinase [Rhodocytophaga aerolata]MDO1446911.1 carbohydrate kinase [Rhodocytophaga aerolata]